MRNLSHISVASAPRVAFDGEGLTVQISGIDNAGETKGSAVCAAHIPFTARESQKLGVKIYHCPKIRPERVRYANPSCSVDFHTMGIIFNTTSDASTN